MKTEQSYSSNMFRANVGIMVINQEGKVLALERSDIPGAWQMPQGGLEQNEEPIDAALREVWEETAIPVEKLELIEEYPEWLAYELPPEMRRRKTGRGQVQKWFLFRFTGKDQLIRLDKAAEKEFSTWKWTRFDKLIEKTIAFRKPLYLKLAKEFHRYL